MDRTRDILMAWLSVAAMLTAQPPDFEHLYRQALEQREKSLGRDARKTRESARDLALYLAARGEYGRAAAYREPAIELADSIDGATALHNWAVSLEERDAATAERMYRKALEIRAKRLDPLDVELATTRLNLAALLVARGNAEAGRLASAALVAFEKKLGPADARTGAACGVLGAAEAVRGNVVNAERLFRRALAIAEKAHGPRSVETASALENLADLLSQTGRESAARPLFDRAEKIRAGAR
jgi:tetratricopeptide (TPR) repeat protein